MQRQAIQASLRQLDYEVDSFHLFEPIRNVYYEFNRSHDHFYAWVPITGVLPEFDPYAFCIVLPGDVLFVGDSLSDQQFQP